MKLWSALLLALALGLSGFVGVAHAGNADHRLHDAGISHECPDEAGQDSHKDGHGKTSAAKSLCEMACHTQAAVNAAPSVVPQAAPYLIAARIIWMNQIAPAGLATTPDQPPKQA